MERSSLRGFRITSARRNAVGVPLRGILLFAIGIAAVSVVAGRACYDTPPDLSPVGPSAADLRPSQSPAEATVTPTPTASPSPVYAAFVPQLPSPKPTPLPPVKPRRRPPPTPTPRVSECVVYRWEADEGMPALGHIMISVRATNRCRRALGIGDVGFEAVAWREGSVQITRRSYPLEPVRRGASFDVVFDLPGSTSWYDRIELFILDPR